MKKLIKNKNKTPAMTSERNHKTSNFTSEQLWVVHAATYEWR